MQLVLYVARYLSVWLVEMLYIVDWKNSKTMVNVEERQRAEAIRFKEAGLGAIQKTYSYDPTKVKSDSAISTKPKRLE